MFFEQLAHQFHRCSLIAPWLHQQIENLAFVVNRAPEQNWRPTIITAIYLLSLSSIISARTHSNPVGRFQTRVLG